MATPISKLLWNQNKKYICIIIDFIKQAARTVRNVRKWRRSRAKAKRGYERKRGRPSLVDSREGTHGYKTYMQEVETIMLKSRKIVMSLLLWSVLSCFIFFSNALNYSNRWTVQIDGDNEEANRLARRHGFVNQGKVSLHESVGNLTTQRLLYLPYYNQQ